MTGNKPRITSAKIQTRMWSAGKPSTSGKFARVFFVARKAGLTDGQAMALAMIAFDAANGYVENLSASTNALRCATLDKRADDAPRGLFAYIRAKLGVGFHYVSDAQIHDTGMNDHPGWSAWANSQTVDRYEHA